MSRIGRRPITIPAGVKVELKGKNVALQGPKGKVDMDVHPRMQLTVVENTIEVKRPTNAKTDRALHGLTRALVKNMVVGVTAGYSKKLLIEGVGFKAIVKDNAVNLSLGYTHEIKHPIPAGIEVKCPSQTEVHVSGVDKQLVGQVAADLRHYHEPEPYKGKGIRYSDEVVRRKQGKTVG